MLNKIKCKLSSGTDCCGADTILFAMLSTRSECFSLNELVDIGMFYLFQEMKMFVSRTQREILHPIPSVEVRIRILHELIFHLTMSVREKKQEFFANKKVVEKCVVFCNAAAGGGRIGNVLLHYILNFLSALCDELPQRYRYLLTSSKKSDTIVLILNDVMKCYLRKRLTRTSSTSIAKLKKMQRNI